MDDASERIVNVLRQLAHAQKAKAAEEREEVRLAIRDFVNRRDNRQSLLVLLLTALLVDTDSLDCMDVQSAAIKHYFITIFSLVMILLDFV